MFTPIRNKAVILTGASRGIGRGMAYKFAEHGARILLINRNEQEGSELAQQLSNKNCEAYYFPADVSSEADMANAAEFVAKIFGNVDILCANAGIYPSASLESLSVQEWDKVVDVNLKGTFLTVKSFLNLLKKAEYGRIILTSSITGSITGYPGWSHYGATKAGQLGFMRSIAIELASYGITVNSILPGNIKTEGVGEMGEEYSTQMLQAIPMKKLGHVDDIANTALFLASKEAGYITGQTIVVDGGQVLPESLSALN